MVTHVGQRRAREPTASTRDRDPTTVSASESYSATTAPGMKMTSLIEGHRSSEAAPSGAAGTGHDSEIREMDGGHIKRARISMTTLCRDDNADSAY